MTAEQSEREINEKKLSRDKQKQICRLNVAKHDCIATQESLKQLINREKEGTKEGRSEWKEERRIEEGMFPLVLSPHVSDSPMDDLWRALSSSVIGRHVGSQCRNESTREAEISQDLCGQCSNCSNLQREVGAEAKGETEG